MPFLGDMLVPWRVCLLGSCGEISGGVADFETSWRPTYQEPKPKEREAAREYLVPGASCRPL